MGGPKHETPEGPKAAAALLADCAAAGHSVRFRGGATKYAWGGATDDPDVVLATSALRGVSEYDPGDLTAVVHAGTPLAELQAVLAGEGQRLALDPPAAERGATVGGVVATADSGPLRHRYGGARDLLLGITVALSDGSIAHAGGKVIKNVAGYDLAKLFAGSFGTLGLVLDVAVRLHPQPVASATAVGRGADPAALTRAAAGLAHAPIEAECLDAAWDGATSAGAVLARFGGVNAALRAGRVRDTLAAEGLDVDIVDGDDEDRLWQRQRDVQRAADDSHLVLKLSAVPTLLEAVLETARSWRGDVSARAALGLAWLRLEVTADDAGVEMTAAIREGLSHTGASIVVLDGPAGTDHWGPPPDALGLMRRVKQRFDPAGICAPGLYVGGI